MGTLRIITLHKKKDVCCRHIAEGCIIKYSCQFSFVFWQSAVAGPPGLPKAPELIHTVGWEPVSHNFRRSRILRCCTPVGP